MVNASEEVEDNSMERSKRYFLTPWETSLLRRQARLKARMAIGSGGEGVWRCNKTNTRTNYRPVSLATSTQIQVCIMYTTSRLIDLYQNTSVAIVNVHLVSEHARFNVAFRDASVPHMPVRERLCGSKFHRGASRDTLKLRPRMRTRSV